MSHEAHIFISYAREDSEFALRLARDLGSAGVNIWLDQHIRPGVRWDRAVEQALRTCDRLLVILSPASVASENVLDEVALAFDWEKQIVPVLYRPCEIPFRLRRLQYVDFTSDYNQGLTTLLTELQGTEAPEIAKAVVKRFPWKDAYSLPLKTLEILVDERSGHVGIRGDLLDPSLTELEYKLFAYLYKRRNQICTRDDIAIAVWETTEGVTDAQIDQLVRRVRKRIELDPANPQYIETVRGRGYRLNLTFAQD